MDVRVDYRMFDFYWCLSCDFVVMFCVWYDTDDVLCNSASAWFHRIFERGGCYRWGYANRCRRIYRFVCVVWLKKFCLATSIRDRRRHGSRSAGSSWAWSCCGSVWCRSNRVQNSTKVAISIWWYWVELVAGPSTFDSSLPLFCLPFLWIKLCHFSLYATRAFFFKKKSQHDEPRHNQINIHAKVQAKHVSLHK